MRFGSASGALAVGQDTPRLYTSGLSLFIRLEASAKSNRIFMLIDTFSRIISLKNKFTHVYGLSCILFFCKTQWISGSLFTFNSVTFLQRSILLSTLVQIWLHNLSIHIIIGND